MCCSRLVPQWLFLTFISSLSVLSLSFSASFCGNLFVQIAVLNQPSLMGEVENIFSRWQKRKSLVGNFFLVLCSGLPLLSLDPSIEEAFTGTQPLCILHGQFSATGCIKATIYSQIFVIEFEVFLLSSNSLIIELHFNIILSSSSLVKLPSCGRILQNYVYWCNIWFHWQNLQRGETMTIEGQAYTISAVTRRYHQLRKGKYEPSEKRLHV